LGKPPCALARAASNRAGAAKTARRVSFIVFLPLGIESSLPDREIFASGRTE
jgi:hypothetical protein